VAEPDDIAGLVNSPKCGLRAGQFSATRCASVERNAEDDQPDRYNTPDDPVGTPPADPVRLAGSGSDGSENWIKIST
jgi:hypothetical protein